MSNKREFLWHKSPKECFDNTQSCILIAIQTNNMNEVDSNAKKSIADQDS